MILRSVRVRWWIAGTLLAISPLAFLRVVPAGSLAVLQNRVGRSNPLLLSEGAHWRIPGWESIYVYPSKPVHLRGDVQAESSEKTSVSLPFEFEVGLDEQTLLRAHRQSNGLDARDWLRAEAARLLRVVASRAATYQLLREELAPDLQASLRHGLEPLGLVEGSLKVGPGKVGEEVLASYDPEKLVRLRRDTGTKVVLIGLDGADWEVALPMIRRGELPTLARLRREGAHGRIRTNDPPLSPLLWTTVATGKPPDVHGINDFLVLDPGTRKFVPISSEFRKVKALWNIASDAGLTSEFVAWWATWPAETVRGIMVSDRVAYSLFSFLSGQPPAGGETYPAAYFQEVRPSLKSEEDVTLEEVRGLVKVTASEFENARKPDARRQPAEEDLESIATLIRVLASTESYHRIALDLLRRKQPDLFGVYYQGIDEVSHRFAHLAPPRMSGVSEARFRKYSGAVAAFYRLQDRLLGDLLQQLSPDSTVILLSDHGFASGPARPKEFTPFIEGQPGLWHAPYGLLLIWGKHVRPGPLPVASLFDIAPTILDLLGLPPAEDLPGRSLRSALDDSFAGGDRGRKIASYEAFGDPLRPAREGEASPSGAAASEAMIETLRSLGYVGPAPAQEGASPHRGGAQPTATTALYHANLASILAAKGKLEEAEAEYRKALQNNPDTYSALDGLSRLEESKRRPDQALALLQRIVSRGMRHEPTLYLRMAGLFAKAGREEDGLLYLEGLASRKQDEPLLDAARGVLYSRLNEPAKAEEALRKALAKDPVARAPMEELFVLYDKRGRLPELIPDLEGVLRHDDGSFMHHNWLGLALRRAGDLAGAEKELRRSQELAPAEPGPAANLGSLLLQLGRVEEAADILHRALTRDPSSLEARINLIVALGRLRKLEEARSRFDEGLRLEPQRPGLYNAMAFAYSMNGRRPEAESLLNTSLSFDPHQSEALRLLREVEGSGKPGAPR